MKDGRYRHVNWPMIVMIEGNCIVEFIREPMITYGYWAVVRESWFRNMLDKRPFSDEEMEYFIYEDDQED